MNEAREFAVLLRPLEVAEIVPRWPYGVWLGARRGRDGSFRLRAFEDDTVATEFPAFAGGLPTAPPGGDAAHLLSIPFELESEAIGAALTHGTAALAALRSDPPEPAADARPADTGWGVRKLLGRLRLAR
jgi:hypothetical protein